MIARSPPRGRSRGAPTQASIDREKASLQQRSNDLTAIWEGVREELRAKVPPSAFESWLEPLQAVGLQGSRLYVEGPTASATGSSAATNRSPSRRSASGCRTITEIVFAEAGEGAATTVARPLGRRGAGGARPATSTSTAS